jgi:hypothetical protein
MAGFKQNPLQFINLIRDNLNDRYQRGFPILKELIQNTDDAKASRLDFGLSPGIPSANHPLLRGPCLFLINNGEFSKSDREGIFSFALNSKADDDSSIGKFGLGMKSVFHLCEAFFFLARERAQDDYSEILNPWCGQSPDDLSVHNNWEDFNEEDVMLIYQQLATVIDKSEAEFSRVFILWLPLRTKVHLELEGGGTAGAITNEFYGDDPNLLAFLDEPSLPNKIASLIPLLSHLKEVHYWNFSNDRSFSIYDVVLAQGNQGLGLLSKTRNATQSEIEEKAELRGKINFGNKDSKDLTLFSGYESYGWNKKLIEMHDHELWPSSNVNDKWGVVKEAKDKARPHGAVIFSRIKERGNLSICWSVFLPLDESTSEKISCDGEYAYTLTLHGYFFIDAGRQHIDGWGQWGLNVDDDTWTDDKKLKCSWNKELAYTKVFPLILPAIAEFSILHKLKQGDQTILSKALLESSLWTEHRDIITTSQCWVKSLSKGGIEWCLKENDVNFLEIPEPRANDFSRPWLVFPSLNDLFKDTIFVINDAPHLVNTHVKKQWSKEQLLELLSSVDIEKVFIDQKLLSYFKRFISQPSLHELKTLDVQSRLISILRKALIFHGERVLQKNRTEIQDILSCIKQENIFEIDKNPPEELLKTLLTVNTKLLLIPGSFKPKNYFCLSLGEEDAVLLLKSLNQKLSDTTNTDDLTKTVLRISLGCISAVHVDRRKSLMGRCSDLSVLSVFDCRQGSERAVSANQIEKASRNGLLFGYSQGIDESRFGLGNVFQQVLVNGTVLILKKETLSLILDHDIAQCNASSVLNSLVRHHHLLGGIEGRCELLEKITVPESESGIKGLRYLLHGNPKHFNSEETLWLLGNEQKSVWTKLWSVMQPSSSTWNLLDPKIGDVINGAIRKECSIRDIQATSIIDELRSEDGTIALDTSSFNEDDCSIILGAVRDETLWKRMPFHWSVNGTAVSVNSGNPYLNTANTDLDKQLLSSIKLIKLSSNSQIRSMQETILNPLDETGLIDVYLSSPYPENYTLQILDNLLVLEDKRQPIIDEALKDKITTIKWLSSKIKENFSPEDIIDLDSATDELNRILDEEPNVFCLPLNLAEKIQNHPFFSQLSDKYFSHNVEALQQLALILTELESYRLGGVDIKGAEELNNFTEVLNGYSHPGWQLLSVLKECVSIDACFKHPYLSMNDKLPIDDLIDLLKWLSSTGTDNKKTVSVYNAYLKLFASAGTAKTRLSELHLLNHSGHWVKASELASNAEGISKQHLLDREQGSILSGLIFNVNWNDDQEGLGNSKSERVAFHPDAAHGVLESYFSKWQDRVSDPLIAALLLLMGGQEKIRHLADEYLGHHSLEWLIGEFPWVIPRTEHHDDPEWLNGFEMKKAVDYFSFTVRVNKKNVISLNSIIGGPINVSIAKDCKTLFLGNPYYRDGGRQVSVVIQPIDVGEFSETRLTEIIKESICWLLRQVYNQNGNDFSGLWSELDKSDQIDIELARTLILDNIPFYLKQLGALKNDELDFHLKAYDIVRKQVAEFKNSTSQDEYKGRKENLLQDLQEFIENSASASADILEAIRTKIRDYQYQEWGIPFEIFQNADDALLQLELIEAWPFTPEHSDYDLLPASRCKFVVNIQEGQITFMHWGRAINQVGSADFPSDVHGFDNDLEHMVILAASDKGENVTGKFGLGFKSVLLVSDHPELVSGRLRTQIVGGILPTVWDGGDAIHQTLRNNMPDYRWPGTAINLPLRNGCGHDFIEKFIARAGMLIAFSRKINQIEIQQAENSKEIFNWRPERLCGIDKISSGCIQVSKRERIRVVKFDLGEGSLLLPVNSEGFKELPDSMPNIWVTAPITESEKLGFAINAMFEIDAGRSRLAANSKFNQEIGEKLGLKFESLLLKMLNSDWDTRRSQLLLSKDLSQYHFVLSLWNTLLSKFRYIDKESEVRLIAGELLSTGLGGLSRNNKIVPNGLPESFGSLLSWPEIRTVLKGGLECPRILSALCETECFNTVLDMKTAVTSEVSTWLRILVPDYASATDQWVSLDLNAFIEKIGASQKRISLADSKILGQVLNQDAAALIREFGQEASNDFERAVTQLAELSFMADDGSWVKARNLITNKKDDDEKLRWGFSPASFRLSAKYSDTGLDFFFLCRPKLDVPAEKLTEWIFQVETEKHKLAALIYFLKGDLSQEVRDKVLEKGKEGSWLAEIDENSQLISDWSSDEKEELVYNRLKSSQETKKVYQNYQVDDIDDTEPLDAVVVLDKIYLWWKENQTVELKKYEESFYPVEIAMDFSEDDLGNINRISWFTLFAIAHFHTMGRINIVQHKGFIGHCYKQGWWQLFAEKNPDEISDQWIQILKDYFGRQIEKQIYEAWMNRFAVFYKLSRNLDDYVELLQGLAFHQHEFSLESALAPMTNSSQQGGGISAPALSKTLGHLGSSLVIREILRKGIVNNVNLHEHAYVPYKKVRILLSALGCQEIDREINASMASEICNFLKENMDDDKYTFNGSYDIPLRIVGDSWELQMKLLGRELPEDTY